MCVSVPVSVPCTVPLPGCYIISRLLALHLAHVLPKIMDLGQNTLFQMSGQREMRQRHDFPRSGHSFLFILRKFPFFFSVKQLHHTVGSHEVHSQIKLTDVFQKLKFSNFLRSRSHRHQWWSGNSGGTAQQKYNNVKDNLLHSITEALTVAILNTQNVTKNKDFLWKYLKNTNARFPIWVLCYI